MAIKVVFFASPDIALPSFRRLLESSEFDVLALVTQPPKPAKRGKKIVDSNVKTLALSAGIDVLEPEKIGKDPAVIEKLKSYDSDFFVTFAFGQILSREFLKMGLGLNVHPSLLPSLRGATPIQTALMQNLDETGVTIQKMVYEVDAGDIIEQEPIAIDRFDDYSSLEARLAQLSVKLITSALEKIEGNKAVFKPQEGEPSYTRMIVKEDGKLDFNLTASENFGKVRALAHNPGCYFEINGQRVKVLKCAPISDNILYEPKQIIKDKNHFLIKCKDSVLEILSLISPNGKVMDGKAYLNGLRDVEAVD